MTKDEKIEKLERDNLALRDLIHAIFRTLDSKKEVVNEILKSRAEGVQIASSQLEE